MFSRLSHMLAEKAVQVQGTLEVSQNGIVASLERQPGTEECHSHLGTRSIQKHSLISAILCSSLLDFIRVWLGFTCLIRWAQKLKVPGTNGMLCVQTPSEHVVKWRYLGFLTRI